MKGLRRNRWLLWAALVVPALLLRALLPVGYMPGAGGLVLCSGVAGVQSPAAMPGMDMSASEMLAMNVVPGPEAGPMTATGHPHAPMGQGDPCPFAASGAGYAPASTSTALCALVAVERAPQVDHPVAHHVQTILRTQAARGPPALTTA